MGHGKLENVLIEKKGSRKDCFNKRNRGILKKLYQLAYISGCGVHLVIQAEDGNIYEFHRKMNPVLQKTILQASLLNSSSMKNSSSSTSSCHNPLVSKVVNVANTSNSTSSSSSTPRPSKLTNKRMFFNGVKTMDTGLTISPQERVAMMNPSSCSCFDCQKGFSNRFVECIDPTSYMAQPFINNIQCPSLHGHDDLITHPINQHSSHIDHDISKLPTTYISPIFCKYNPRNFTTYISSIFRKYNPRNFTAYISSIVRKYSPRNFMAQFATSSPHLGGLPPLVMMAAHDGLEDHSESEFEQSSICKIFLYLNSISLSLSLSHYLIYETYHHVY